MLRVTRARALQYVGGFLLATVMAALLVIILMMTQITNLTIPEQNVLFERVKLIGYFLAVLMVVAISLFVGGKLYLVSILDCAIGQVLRLQSLTNPNTGKVLFEGVELNIISSDVLSIGDSVRILGRQTNPLGSGKIAYLAGKWDSSEPLTK